MGNKREKSTARIFKVMMFLCVMLCIGLLGANSYADSEVVAGDFSSLKSTIEAPDRDETVLVPGGNYLFNDTVNVYKDLRLKNKEGEKVEFTLGMFNDDSNSTGKTMLNVESGKTTFDADNDENLVFNGTSEWNVDTSTTSRKKVTDATNRTNVSAKGVFVTVKSGAEAVINHATFKNSSNAGARTGAIYVDYKGKLKMNGGLVSHNYLTMTQTTANSKYFASGARSAGIAVYGGDFQMDGGRIENNYNIYGNGGAIAAMGTNSNSEGTETSELVRSKITINSGDIVGNSANDWENSQNAYGGAIFMDSNSDATINGGNFTDNYSMGAGGFIFNNWASSLTVNDGNFEHNEASRGGGAIGTFDHFVIYDVSNNTNITATNNPYNISNIEDWYARGLGVKLIIKGGTFNENKAYMGGAVYVASNNAEINAGTFTNNEANRFGGAIYLSSLPYKMKIRNAYVSNNYADERYGTLGGNLYPDMEPSIYHLGSGGGVWYCPTGTGNLYISNGIGIFDNTASIEGDDFTSMIKYPDQNQGVSVANRMLGGGWVDWYSDAMNARYKSDDKPVTDLKARNSNIMLKSSTSERSKRVARTLATTVFTGNKAKRGGAIGTNGHIDFGDSDLEFNLVVNKVWSDKVSKKKPVTAVLYIVDNEGNELELDSAELNKDNGYTHTFSRLPIQSGKVPTVKDGYRKYVVKELVDNEFVASYSYRVGDGDLVEGNEFSTKNLVNGDNVIFNVKNDEKPTPKNPTPYVPTTETKVPPTEPTDPNTPTTETKVPPTEPKNPNPDPKTPNVVTEPKNPSIGKKSQPKKPNIPETSDGSNIAVYAVLSILSMVLVVVEKKRKTTNS